jgi:hypothetical protein
MGKNMKLVLVSLLLLCSVFSFAEDEKVQLWPRVTAWSHGVDLRIDNFTEKDFSCSGPIYIYHISGRYTTEYYFGRVYSRFNEYRHFSNRTFGDRIVSARHSIFCSEL